MWKENDDTLYWKLWKTDQNEAHKKKQNKKKTHTNHSTNEVRATKTGTETEREREWEKEMSKCQTRIIHDSLWYDLFFSCLRFPFHFVWIVSIPINQNSKLNDVWFYVHIRIHVHYARISILEFPTHQVLLMDGFYDRPSMTLLSLFK